MQRAQERIDYLKKLAQAGRAIKNGEEVVSSGYLEREALQNYREAFGFISDEKERLNQRRKIK